MFSDDEIQGAVEAIVRSSVRREYGTLGNRRTNVTFSDIQDAAAGVLILYPDAPFYIVDLGTRRLHEQVEFLKASTEELFETVQAVGRRTSPVSDTSSLANARAALLALESAAQSRSAGFKNIEQVSAYQRFVSNTDRFLSNTGKNVKHNGEIVKTPQEARALLAGLVNTLKEQHAEVLRRARLLAGALQDFENMQLPTTVFTGVISRARGVLAERIEELEALTPQERLSILRNTILDILAARASLKSAGSMSGPTTFVLYEGSFAAYQDDDHPITPASVLSDIPGPYPILVGEQSLDVVVDSGPTITISLPGSFLAALEGTAAEPYDVYGAGNPPPVGLENNDQLVLKLDGFGDILVPLTNGNARTAEQIVADINTAIPAPTPLIAEQYFNPLKFSGPVDLDATGSSSDLDVIRSSGSWSDLGVEEGDLVIITDSTSSMLGDLYEVEIVSSLVLTCAQVSGGPSADETAKNVEIGPPNRFVRIRITDDNDTGKPDYRETGLTTRTAIYTADGTDSGWVNIGFLTGMESRCRPTTAQEIAQAVNTSFAAAVGGVARVRAEAEFESIYSGLGRSEPTDPQRITIYKLRGTAAIGSGLSPTLSTTGAEAAGVQVGDYFVIRGSATSADVGIVGTVTGLTDSSISLSMNASITAGDVDYELGPDLSSNRNDLVIRVSGGTENDGEYITTASPEPTDPNYVPFDAVPTRPLSFFQNLGGQPFFFNVELGYYKVRFSSLGTGLDAEIEIGDFVPGDDATPRFFSSPSVGEKGLTKYLQLTPPFPKGVEAGDTLEAYFSSYSTPDTTSVIAGVEPTLRLLETETASTPVDATGLPISIEAEPPFIRIRKAKKQTFDQFEEASEAWLELPENQERYFRDLDRHINVLTTNLNPSLSDVNNAKLHVQALSDALDQYTTILDDYEAPVVAPVDSMLSSFLQRGADRAVDLLLEGQFSTFFGLSQASTSYAGAVMEQIQEVAQQDLPIKKTKRQLNQGQEALLASWQEPDYEFEQSDLAGVDEVEIPADFDKEFPGQSF